MTYPEPTIDTPTLAELEAMVFGDDVTATDDCPIEPDGICQHGYPSWLLQLGLI